VDRASNKTIRKCVLLETRIQTEILLLC